MATFLATVACGLEEVAAEELSSFGLTVASTEPGVVNFEGPEFPSAEGVSVLRELNHWVRGVDRLGVLLAAGEARDLDGCYELARAVDYGALIGARQSFAVRAQRQGTHPFGSLEVAGAVGEAVIDSFAAASGRRLAVSLRRPEVIVRVDLHAASCRVWLDATGDAPLYLRDYRRQLHPASMRASMVHLMLRLAGWRGEPLLDPMTGIGTIPIEAALYARGIAPGSLRRSPCAIDVMRGGSTSMAAFPGDAAGSQLLRPPALLDPDEELDVRGIERYERHLQGAWLNLAAAGPLAGVRMEQGDACRLERSIPTGHYRHALVNPPFGRRVGSLGIVADLYRRFARSAADCGVENVVALAESGRTMCAALERAGYEVVREIAVRYGDLPAQIIMARSGAGCGADGNSQQHGVFH